MDETITTIVNELFEYLEDNFEPEDYDSYDEMCDDIISQENDIVEYCARQSQWADVEPENIMPIAADFMSMFGYDSKEILKRIKSYDTMVFYAYFSGFDIALNQFMSNFDDYDFC